jgi:hypothetical protein
MLRAIRGVHISSPLHTDFRLVLCQSVIWVLYPRQTTIADSDWENLEFICWLFLKNLRTKDNEKLTGILYLLMALLHKQEDDSAGILDL